MSFDPQIEKNQPQDSSELDEYSVPTPGEMARLQKFKEQLEVQEEIESRAPKPTRKKRTSTKKKRKAPVVKKEVKVRWKLVTTIGARWSDECPEGKAYVKDLDGKTINCAHVIEFYPDRR